MCAQTSSAGLTPMHCSRKLTDFASSSPGKTFARTRITSYNVCYTKLLRDDPYLLQLKSSWDASLMAAFRELPRLNLEALCDSTVTK